MHLARITLLAAAPLTLAVAGWLTGCGRESGSATQAAADKAAEPAAAASATPAARGPAAALESTDPIVVLQTTAGPIKLRLFADKAPQTVENFLRNYVQQGFYNETIFHHVEPGAMLIGGGYTATLEPKPARTPIYNESRNGLSNRRGTVAMIHDPESPHSATSQFFINLADNPDLDFKAGETDDVYGYCVFGEVVEGMDVVERIAQQPTTARGSFERVPSPEVAIREVQQLR